MACNDPKLQHVITPNITGKRRRYSHKRELGCQEEKSMSTLQAQHCVKEEKYRL